MEVEKEEVPESGPRKERPITRTSEQIEEPLGCWAPNIKRFPGGRLVILAPKQR